MASTQRPMSMNGLAQATRKPMYEDAHQSCSVLMGRFRNADLLLRLSAKEQFQWLHRFYLVMDRIAGQHQVYKLNGGPHGFLLSAGVAEPDEHHAITLLRFALHLHKASHQIFLPGMVPLDLCLSLASGPAASGLLGTMSLTYQVVGRCMHEARLLVESQQEVQFMVAGSMARQLRAEVAGELVLLGSLPLGQAQGQEPGHTPAEACAVEVYTLPSHGSMRLTSPKP